MENKESEIRISISDLVKYMKEESGLLDNYINFYSDGEKLDSFYPLIEDEIMSTIEYLTTEGNRIIKLMKNKGA